MPADDPHPAGRSARSARSARAGARLAVLCAAPALVLAVAGLWHPHSLTSATAATWTWLHVVALPVFPLVGVGLAVAVRGRRDVAAWAVRLGAYGFATAYTALDVVSGITAGHVTAELPGGAPRPDEVRSIFEVGGRLGEVGSWALLAAGAVLSLDALRRHRWRALPTLLLPAGAWAVHVDHIAAPLGAAGMVLVAAGTAAAVLLAPPRAAGRRPAHDVPPAPAATHVT